MATSRTWRWGGLETGYADCGLAGRAELTSLENGSLAISRSVERWNLRISWSAAVPGLNRLFCRGTGSPAVRLSVVSCLSTEACTSNRTDV
jgi:hypothetical protein